MSDDFEIDVVVHATRRLLDEASKDLAGLQAATGAVAGDLDDAERGATALMARLGLDAEVSGTEVPSPPELRSAPPRPTLDPFERAAVVERARANLRARGVDPDQVELEQFLDDDELERIRRRFTGATELQVRLDRYDVVAAIVAGLVGGAIDAVFVATPGASSITGALKQMALPSDNWLARLAPVPYDLGWHADLWLTPAYHRVQTPGHDPLVGLVWGTVDILSGQLTGLRPDGTLGVIARNGKTAYPDTWPAALGLQILHTLSDVCTHSGIPLPGWSILSAIATGEETERNLAQTMYQRGYDSWHLFTMATAPAAVELLCRGYWSIRCGYDDELHDATIGVATGDLPRYQALSLIAHGVSAMVDLATFAAAGANPLMLNYAQLVTLARKAAVAASTRPPDPADVALANQRVLETGWCFE
ncbi:MAG: hypothetical protein ACE367_25450 [Acidimicrobiales bacterium]